MSKQQNTQQSPTTPKVEDTSNTPMNGETIRKPTSTFRYEQVENTPFYIAGTDEEGFAIIIAGNQRITKFYRGTVSDPVHDEVDLQETAKEIIKEEFWNITAAIIAINIEHYTKQMSWQQPGMILPTPDKIAE